VAAAEDRLNIELNSQQRRLRLPRRNPITAQIRGEIGRFWPYIDNHLVPQDGGHDGCGSLWQGGVGGLVDQTHAKAWARLMKLK
jgi:hypothetical protein